MEYRILLIKDINFDNIRYSPIKKSSTQNRYSYITYFNQEEEIQNVVIQSRQMNILELSKNEKGHYHITFQLNSYMKNFLEKFEQKINKDLLQFRSEKLYKSTKENKTDESETNIQNIYTNEDQRDSRPASLYKSENSLPSEFSEGKKNSSPPNKHSVSFQSQNEYDYEDYSFRLQRKMDEKYSQPIEKMSVNPKNSTVLENLSIETESGILPIDFQKNSVISGPAAALSNPSKSLEDRASETKGFRLDQAPSSPSANSVQKKSYKFRSSISEYNNHFSIKCKIGHISNLVVFDQYKKMYDEESEIIKLLKIPNAVVVPIIECLGLWISNEDEAGISWICHHVKVIQSNTLFKKYLFIDENSDESDSEEKDFVRSSSKPSLEYVSQSVGQGNDIYPLRNEMSTEVKNLAPSFSQQKKNHFQKTEEPLPSNINKQNETSLGHEAMDIVENLYSAEDTHKNINSNNQNDLEKYDSFRRWKKNLPEKVVVDRS